MWRNSIAFKKMEFHLFLIFIFSSLSSSFLGMNSFLKIIPIKKLTVLALETKEKIDSNGGAQMEKKIFFYLIKRRGVF